MWRVSVCSADVLMDPRCVVCCLDDIVRVLCGEDHHGRLNVRGMTVVDVGAGCGDSVLYFVSRGTRRVVAVEPNPDLYDALVNVVRANRVEDRVVPLRAAVGRQHGVMRVRREGFRYALAVESEDGVETPVLTLSDIGREYCLYGDCVLKVDCEGCELDMVGDDVSEYFREVVVEAHSLEARDRVRSWMDRMGFKTEVWMDVTPYGFVYIVYGRKSE